LLPKVPVAQASNAESPGVIILELLPIAHVIKALMTESRDDIIPESLKVWLNHDRFLVKSDPRIIITSFTNFEKQALSMRRKMMKKGY
jgi:hypothetical protein